VDCTDGGQLDDDTHESNDGDAASDFTTGCAPNYITYFC
jgi:hypothetical protein